ncbi:MAG: sugar phosphate isomerase/epimerase [Anaerolineae bacterium]|nr:sugar phosphate isomerase/epimerase [Anaerolineae bacterium]
MIEFACHTWAFNDLTLPEALGTIARMGFRYVDIGSGPSLNAPRAAENPRRAAADILDDLKLFNLKLSDLYLMLPRISLADEAKRSKELELYKALIPFAVALGTPGITLSPGLVHAAEDTEAHDRTVAALREMVKAAQEVNLAVSIEPHMDSMAQTVEAALRFVKDVPGLRLTLDWAHLICQDIFHDDILKLLPHTRHIQIRQAARAQLQLPFERGRIDVARVMASIIQAGYDGTICVEYMNTPGWHGMETVNALVESVKMRDALRDSRDKLAAGR